jgi:hypothetical protein
LICSILGYTKILYIQDNPPFAFSVPKYHHVIIPKKSKTRKVWRCKRCHKPVIKEDWIVRREFLKSISGLLVVIPFLSTEKIVSGTDKAVPDGDYTGINNVSPEEWEVYYTKYVLKDYAQSAGITWWPSSNRYNCKCSL